MLALMEGRFDDAEALIEETAALGRRAQSWNAAVSQRVALFVLRREQGRLAELADSVRRVGARVPGAAAVPLRPGPRRGRARASR